MKKVAWQDRMKKTAFKTLMAFCNTDSLAVKHENEAAGSVMIYAINFINSLSALEIWAGYVLKLV